MSHRTNFDTDVLVVGTGPTGATTALALATYGIRAHMISRAGNLADGPRAHITNQRANEVFRDLGLSDEIARFATPWELMGDTPFATSLAGEELVRIRTWGTGDDRKGNYERASPCGMVDLIQPLLEPILFNAAVARGATSSFNTEYVSHSQDADGVSVRLHEHQTGRKIDMRARFLVGADGAHSRVVNDLKLPIEGHMGRAGTVYTIFKADLSRYTAHRPSILYWIATAHASFGEIGLGVLRAVRPWTEWIAGWGIDINKGEPDLSDASIREKIGVLIGDPSIEIEIDRTTVWYVNQAFATQYSKGRVFCGGDAVHRHPPSSGLGMNTSVQDGFNLAWKLAYVIKGHAGEKLLESYSDERAPVGKQVVMRANQSRLDYAPLNACFRVPEAENPVAAGVERLRDRGPKGLAARRALRAAIDLKQTEFNAQGVEMNQRYASNAVLPDASCGPEQWARDPLLYVQPTTRPGARLPHAWLVNWHGVRVSTLDVIGKGAFSLVTGLSGGAWAAAAGGLDFHFLRTVVIGQRDVQDLYLEWQRIREIEEAGALLVRPDGYVAWREMSPVYDPIIARDKLTAAIDAVLSRPQPVGAPRGAKTPSPFIAATAR